MGMNGLDVAGLRPFDLVIPFTIQKGEITGDDELQAEPAADSDPHSPHSPHPLTLTLSPIPPTPNPAPLLQGKFGCLLEKWPNPTSQTTRTAPLRSSMRPPKLGCTRWTSSMTASTSLVALSSLPLVSQDKQKFFTFSPAALKPLYSVLHRKSLTVLRGLHEQWEC